MTPLVDAFGAAWDWVKEKVSGIGDMLSTVFTRETLTEDQIAEITERAREVTEGVIGWFTSIPTRLGEMASDLVAAGRQLIQSLWDGAVEKFDAFLDWVRGIPGRIVDAIGRIDLTGIIRWPEPPDWWTRLTGGDVPQPVTPAAIEQRAAEQGRTPEAEAAATLEKLQAQGPLPTEAQLSGLSSEAEDLRSRMLSLRREIDRLSSGPGNGAARSAEARAAYAELETQLAAVELQIREGTARADEMNAALAIIGGFEGAPRITTDSIDRAIARAQELGRALDRATGARDVPAPSGSNPAPEIDGARADGGPISRGGTYLVGEEGPELVTPSRAGFVNTFGAIHDAVAALQRLPSALTPLQAAGPQLISMDPIVDMPSASEVPAPDVDTPADVPAPEVHAPEDVPAPDVSAPAAVPAPDVNAPKAVTAPAVSTPADVPAPEVNAPGSVPAPEVNAPEAVNVANDAERSQANADQPKAPAKPTTIEVHVGQITVTPTIHTTERVDPAELAGQIAQGMRAEVREAFRGVFADTGMRFA